MRETPRNDAGEPAARARPGPPERTAERSLLVAEGLGVALDGRPILRGLDFRVERGTWVGILGPNGSGKTTLMRTIAGGLAYRGTLELEGRSVHAWRVRALARRLAFVRQSLNLTFDLSVEELVLLGRSPHKGWLDGYTSHDRAQVAQALEEVELSGFEGRSVLTLSGGELQRAMLAQALVQEADLLLLDEPTAHLDVHYQFDFMERVERLVAAGRTVLAVFHDLELAARYASRLLVLDRGRIVASGPPQAVLTEELIATVFRMEADCTEAPDGTLGIRYRAPLTRPGDAPPR